MSAVANSEVVSASAEKKPKNLSGSLAMFRNGKSLTGIVILAVFILIAVIGSWIAPYDPNAVDPTALAKAPSSAHWMGTDHLGRDVLSQVLVGTRGVLVVGALAGCLATVLSIIIGVSAGYVRGVQSEFLSLITSVFLVIPSLPLVIIVVSKYPEGGVFLISVILAATGWSWGARILRSQTLSLRSRDFVQASRLNGEPVYRIIFVEMLPNLAAIIASSFVGTVTAAVLTQTTLAFVGVTPISDWNWGTILYWAQSNNAFHSEYWWWYMAPGICIALLGMCLALISLGIDEYVNPRLRSAGDLARAEKKRAKNARRAGRSQTQLGTKPPRRADDAK